MDELIQDAMTRYCKSIDGTFRDADYYIDGEACFRVMSNDILLDGLSFKCSKDGAITFFKTPEMYDLPVSM